MTSLSEAAGIRPSHFAPLFSRQSSPAPYNTSFSMDEQIVILDFELATARQSAATEFQ